MLARLSRVVRQTHKSINLVAAVLLAFSSLAIATPALFNGAAAATSTTYYVRSDGSDINCDGLTDAADVGTPGSTCAFSSIQQAVDSAANSGDTIMVGAGTYNENLVVNKSIDLEGNGATINGSDGFAVTLESGGVTINGFTITANSDGEGIYNIDAQTPSHDISGTTITNNVFSGSSRAVALESNATGTVKVNDNQFSSNDKDLAVADNSFDDLQVKGNTFNEPSTNDTGVQIGPDGTGTISSFEFEDNTVYGNVNIGANVEGATVSDNTFNAGSVVGGSLEFQAALHNGSIVENNTFNGNSSYACLQLFGSQYGLPHPSNGVTISGNDFQDCGDGSSPYYNYAIQLSQDVNNVTINGNNTIDNAYDGINTRFFSGSAWTLNSGISISGNQITNSRHLAVNNTVNGTLNASKNWFGSASNPSAMVSSNVTYSPWCAQSGCTSYTTGALNLSLSATSGQASTPAATTTLNGSGSISNFSASIPASTNITAKNSDGSTNTSWDGVIDTPTTTTYSVPGGTTSLAITVGADDGSSLSFDQPVELLFPGQAGKSVGFVKNGAFTQITQTCLGTPTISQLQALDPVGACYTTSGSDLIVWTDHFTTFATYVPAAGTGGGSSSSTTTTSSGSSATSSESTGESASAAEQVAQSATKPVIATLAQPKIAAKEAGGIRWYWWLIIAIIAAAVAGYGGYFYAYSTSGKK